MAKRTKGVFCIEGPWERDLRNKASVRPILTLLEAHQRIPSIYRDCATVEELNFYLGQWVLQRYASYPLLYLAFHGEPNTIITTKGDVTLDDVALVLGDKCQGRIVIFASCGTFDVDRRRLKRFLSMTGALAACGYRADVDWMRSTAFELLLLSAIQDNEFSGRGIRSIREKTAKLRRQFTDLKFRFVSMYD